MSDRHEDIAQEEIDHLQWDRNHFYFKNAVFIPQIYYGDPSTIPEGFNTVILTLDASLSSSLDWKATRQKAQELSPDIKILWNITLGLFSHLTFSLSNEMQFQSFVLALKHFRDTLWKEFKEQSLGVVLYEGRLDFKRGFIWDNAQETDFIHWQKQHNITGEVTQDLMRLYCRDACSAYLQLLQDALSDAVPVFLFFDAQGINDPLTFAQLIAPDRWNRFHLAMKKPVFYLPSLGWEHSSTSAGYISTNLLRLNPLEPTLGVCLPAADLMKPSDHEGLKKVLSHLISYKKPFRLISEVFLTSEWQGIDHLIYTAAGTSIQGKRKLQGFCAAGGIPIHAGEKGLGLEGEISFRPELLTNL